MRTTAEDRWRFGYVGETESRWIFNDIELPQGAFHVALYSQGVNYTFNPNLRINAVVQYNDLSGDLGANVRLHWIYKPGSDLFVVYNENWIAEDLRHRTSTHRQIAVKFTYLIQPWSRAQRSLAGEPCC